MNIPSPSRDDATVRELVLQAGAAFGSGAHPSTAGAIEALKWLRAEGAEFQRALDMGCGSGILALLAASFWPLTVTAVDIQPEAVAATRQNAALNGLEGRVMAFRSDGLAAPEIASNRPYDLIVCNIFAEPILRLAPDMPPLAKGGTVLVLSGILAWLEMQVLETYAAIGFTPLANFAIDEWRTLILRCGEK
jgi:ribosomal protein L11 methyltransferase